jgi:hypothetical protein
MRGNCARLACLCVGIGAIVLGIATPAGAHGCCTLSLANAASGAVGTIATGGGGGGEGAVRPVNIAKPRVTLSDKRLRCSRGTWAGEPTEFTYHWLVGGTAKPGARSATLAITHALRGRKVQCGVTARNSAGSGSALSAPFRVHST